MNRAEKIKLLKDLQAGKITQEELITPKELKIVVFRDDDKTGTHITMNGKKITQEQFEAEVKKTNGRITKIHVVRV